MKYRSDIIVETVQTKHAEAVKINISDEITFFQSQKVMIENVNKKSRK